MEESKWFGLKLHSFKAYSIEVCVSLRIYFTRGAFSLKSTFQSKVPRLCFWTLSRTKIETEKELQSSWILYFQRPEDLGGVISFPLLVPVKPSDPYAHQFRSARIFLKTQWKKPTLILYSQSAVLPFTLGDFVVGNRRGFFENLIPHARVAPRIPGGHLIYYDNPKTVSNYITNFLK